MTAPPKVCHAQWHEGVTGTIFMDCCDANVDVPTVWHALNEAMGNRTGTPFVR